MTVIDTSGVIDFLLGWPACEEVGRLLAVERELRAPDVLVFEVISALRRQTQREMVAAERAHGALADLDDLPLRLYPSMSLRWRAWELRDNFTAGDALFVALAEQLGEPLATKDAALIQAGASRPDLDTEVVALVS